MRKQSIQRTFPLLAVALACATPGYAQDLEPEQAQSAPKDIRYISDQLIIGVRAGAGETYGRIASLATGDAVTVLETGPNGYVRVGLRTGLEGWVQLQYLTEDRPARNRLRELERASELHTLEKARLMEENRALELDNAEMKDRITRIEGERQALQKELGSLRAVAAEAEIPKQQFAKLREESSGLREENKLLRERSRQLKDQRDQWWFAIGGGVSVISLLLGLMAGRAGRRRANPSWR